MCIFKTPKAPPPVQIPEPVANPPAPATEIDPGAQQAQTARAQERRRRLAAQASNTMVTGGEGLTAPQTTANKTSFGA